MKGKRKKGEKRIKKGGEQFSIKQHNLEKETYKKHLYLFYFIKQSEH